MSAKAPQTYQNHARFVPAYHYVAFGILTLNLVYAAWKLFMVPSLDTVMALAVALALLIMLLYLRLFPLKAQDRVIRLEERLRLARLLPGDLQARIEELRPGQLVALRFASDEELPDLVRRTLAGDLANPGAIKKAIRNWRGDTLRV
ncbi:MAG TPA: DUF6526 family protein [Thermoanaerobaculia bacterium]|nr:DUF6526 family protein [Thermoanaerobaculia bacterium]